MIYAVYVAFFCLFSGSLFANAKEVEVSMKVKNETAASINLELTQRHQPTQHFTIEAGHTELLTLKVLVDPANEKEVSFYGRTTASDPDYGQCGAPFIINLYKRYVQATLNKQIVEPGDDLWPPQDPFPVARLTLQK